MSNIKVDDYKKLKESAYISAHSVVKSIAGHTNTSIEEVRDELLLFELHLLRPVRVITEDADLGVKKSSFVHEGLVEQQVTRGIANFLRGNEYLDCEGDFYNHVNTRFEWLIVDLVDWCYLHKLPIPGDWSTWLIKVLPKLQDKGFFHDKNKTTPRDNVKKGKHYFRDIEIVRMCRAKKKENPGYSDTLVSNRVSKEIEEGKTDITKCELKPETIRKLWGKAKENK